MPKEKICYCQSYLVIHLQIGCDGTKEGEGDRLTGPLFYFILFLNAWRSLVANLPNQVRVERRLFLRIRESQPYFN